MGSEYQMNIFIASLETAYGVKIYHFAEATPREKREGFKIVTDELPFESEEGTHFILLMPQIIFQPGPDNRAFLVTGPKDKIAKIVARMEFKSKMPAAERVDDPSGLLTEEEFDRMWGKK